MRLRNAAHIGANSDRDRNWIMAIQDEEESNAAATTCAKSDHGREPRLEDREFKTQLER